ncbi:MAG: methionine adenosyltransferase, partial [Candidatus Aenigmatarchaeota archaeon]
MKILIEELKRVPVYEQKAEIVERKGLGHPDFICDSIVDKISVALSKEYLKRFGKILHHNIDKALLAAGEAENKFGGGKIIKPMKLIIGDRATYSAGSEEIDVASIAIKTAKEWLKENLRFLDVEKHIEYQIELKRTSAALSEIFKKEDEVLGANDTSAVVGYAPLTPTEKIVLEIENFLNSKDFKKRHPESGEDIKV